MSCARTVTCGAGFTHICDRKEGHSGEHTSHWIDRNGVRQISLSWRDEKDGYAVWPGTKGAIRVTKES